MLAKNPLYADAERHPPHYSKKLLDRKGFSKLVARFVHRLRAVLLSPLFLWRKDISEGWKLPPRST